VVVAVGGVATVAVVAGVDDGVQNLLRRLFASCWAATPKGAGTTDGSEWVPSH
jgi:hypothetical protein